VPTLAGNIGVAKKSVYHYLSRLRKAGYNVEEKPVRGRAGRYRKIFRIAS
jgi:biotin operon repressor